MNEEAGFIAALLAEPDDRTTLLVYADWLDERSEQGAELLRSLAAREGRDGWLSVFERGSGRDFGWMQLIGSLHLEPGCRTQYKAPADSDDVFDQTTIIAERADATVCLTIRRRRGVKDFGWWELEVVKR